MSPESSLQITAQDLENGNASKGLTSTLCDLTGVSIPDTAQGKSMKPVLMGEVESVRKVMYGAYCGGTKPGMRSVRVGVE